VCAAGPARADAAGLTMRTVDEVVERNDRAIQACGRGVTHHGGDTVVVMVELTVDAAGHVGEWRRPPARAPRAASSGRCAGWRFPPRG